MKPATSWVGSAEGRVSGCGLKGRPVKIDPGRGLLNVIRVLLPCRDFCYRAFRTTVSDPGLIDVGVPGERPLGAVSLDTPIVKPAKVRGHFIDAICDGFG